jgi:CheY-like chemotaxis protein
MAFSAQRPILLIDDSADDALLMRRAFTRAALRPPLLHHEGEAALRYLQRAIRKEAGAPMPVLILLDIKMHGVDGFDVLEWIKARPELVDVPVLMLTSSNLPQDIVVSQRLGADSFLTKPHSFAELVRLLEYLKREWHVLA